MGTYRFLLIMTSVISLMFISQTQYEFIDGPYVTDEDMKQITKEFLVNKIAPTLNTTYLGQADNPIQQNMTGIIWPEGNHNFISLPVRLIQKKCNKTINVIFKVNTGVSFSILSTQVFQTLYRNCGFQREPYYGADVYINGKRGQAATVFYSSRPPSSDINLLGTDFLRNHQVRFTSKQGKFQLAFGTEDEDSSIPHEPQTLQNSEDL